MKKTSIFTEHQLQFLNLFNKNASFYNQFYFSGGTALAGYYIPYRYSEDLDFFSEKEVDPEMILSFLQSIKKELQFKSFDFNTSFNRNIIHLLFENETLKTEFTFYPFERIDTTHEDQMIYVDSPIDIATNKLFTIYQKPRTRDFIDLFMIQKKYGFSLDQLMKLARRKFDWHIDSLKLGSQLLFCTEVKDYPRLLEDIEPQIWQNHFLQLAKTLAPTILKD